MNPQPKPKCDARIIKSCNDVRILPWTIDWFVPLCTVTDTFPCAVTPQFVSELMAWQKAEKKLHRKFALQILHRV